MTVEPEDNEDDFDITIEDDTPLDDQGKPVAPDEPPPVDEEAEEEKELSNVGERVKKRIDKLTADKHAERRRAEQIKRERDEAVRATQTLLERERALRNQMLQYEGGFVNQAKGRVEAEIAEAKRDFKAAFELGDADAMAEAQEKLARLAPQHEQYSRYRAPEPEKEPVHQYQPQQPPQTQYDPTPDQNLMEFMDANPWFRTDPDMTAFAVGLHQQAAMSDPASVGSKAYYDSIAAKVKKAFGKEEAPAKPRTSAAAPVTRGGSSVPARKQVTLSASQVRLAQRLGLTAKQYAESLLEMEKNQ